MTVYKERIVHGIIWVGRKVSPPLKARLPKSLQGLGTAAEQACHSSSLRGQAGVSPEEGLALCDAYNLAAPTGTSACLVCSLLDWVGRGTKERLVLFPSPPSPRINRWDGFSITVLSEG